MNSEVCGEGLKVSLYDPQLRKWEEVGALSAEFAINIPSIGENCGKECEEVLALVRKEPLYVLWSTLIFKREMRIVVNKSLQILVDHGVEGNESLMSSLWNVLTRILVRQNDNIESLSAEFHAEVVRDILPLECIMKSALVFCGSELSVLKSVVDSIFSRNSRYLEDLRMFVFCWIQNCSEAAHSATRTHNLSTSIANEIALRARMLAALLHVSRQSCDTVCSDCDVLRLGSCIQNIYSAFGVIDGISTETYKGLLLLLHFIVKTVGFHKMEGSMKEEILLPGSKSIIIDDYCKIFLGGSHVVPENSRTASDSKAKVCGGDEVLSSDDDFDDTLYL